MSRTRMGLYCFVIGLFCTIQVFAEDADSTTVKKSKFVGAVLYNSNKVYNGRVDSIDVMYISPSVSYVHKSGLFITASLSYQPNASINRIDEFALESGWNFNIGEKMEGAFTASKYFYDANSVALNSVNNMGAASNLSYDFTLLKVSSTVGLAFGDKTDVSTQFGLSRSFEIGDFSVGPNLLLNAGTQNYYNSYMVAGKSHKSGNTGKKKAAVTTKTKTITTISPAKVIGSTPKIPAVTSTPTYKVKEASKFNVLDYEISAPVSYSLGNFTFDLVPTYSIPVNAVTIESSDNSVELEKLSNHFTVQLGISYEF
jgi:hypothetical protein